MSFKDTIINYLNKTKAEIPALAAAGALLIGTTGAYLSHWKEYCYPLQFSERTQIERDAMERGENPKPSTLYHADALDMGMKVFEAHNTGQLYPSNKELHFAEALQAKYKEQKHHYNLDSLTKGFSENADSLRQEIANFIKTKNALSRANSTIDPAWSHTTHDQYLPLPETRLVTHTDSKGRSYSRLETRIVLKHVWTDHFFNLNKDQANSGIGVLGNYLSSLNERVVAPIVARPSRINEGNYNAMRESRQKIDSKKPVSENELKSIGLSWGQKAKMIGLLVDAQNSIERSERDLPNMTPIVQNAPAYEKKRKYTPAAALMTSSMLSSWAIGSMEGSSAEPPKGFNEYKAFTANLQRGAQDVGAAESIIVKSEGIVGKMRANLEQLAKSPSITKKEIKLAEETRGLAADLIQENFDKGIKVPTKRWYIPVIWGIIGTAVGCLAGLGLDTWAEKNRKIKTNQFEFGRRRYY